MILEHLTDHREKLIYAYALLRGHKENHGYNKDLCDALDDVMDIIAGVVNGADIYHKLVLDKDGKMVPVTEVKADE